MPLAFTSPDSAAGARPELVQPSGAPHPSVLVDVPPLIPMQQRLGLDGTTSPINVVLLAAPHPPGMYLWSNYVNVVAGAAALMDVALSYGDELGAQITPAISYPLGAPGIPAPQIPPQIFSAGALPIVVQVTIGGAVGPPLSVDYTTSIAQTG